MAKGSPIPIEVLNQHVAVLGKTRSGKSSVMRGLVEGLLERQDPVCIVDPKGDWWGIKLSGDGKRPGYPVVIFGGEHADVPINAHAGAAVAELFATGNRPCLVDLGGWTVGDRTRFWIDFASTLFFKTKGLRWLVVDEVHNFAPKGAILSPEAGKALHWANRLASEGLGKGLALLVASQRPQKVHNDLLTSAETLIAMRVLHPSDRGAVTDWIKGCGDPVMGAKVLDTLAQLERGEGWVWSPEINFGPERIKFPMFKTYDSFRPQLPDEAKGLKGWAEVDLDEVKTKLAVVMKEAEANDPRLLKAEVARLTRELAAAKVQAPVEGLDAARRGAYDKGRVDGHAVGLHEGQSSVRLAFGQAEQLARGAAEMVTALAGVLVEKPQTSPVTGMVDDILARAEREGATAPRITKALQSNYNSVKPARAPSAGANNHADLVPLSRPQQKILESLAWWETMGHSTPTRAQVGIKAGMRASGGHFKTRCSELVRVSLIAYDGPDRMRLTDRGRGVAPDPETADSVVASLRPLLSAPQSKILDAMLGGATDRGKIAQHAGMDAAGGHFKTRLSELKRFGIIEYPDTASAILQDWVV